MSFCSSAVAESPRHVLILGDSLSAGYKMNLEQSWVSLVDQKILACPATDLKVINLSTSGDTTRSGLQKSTPALEKYKPALVVIELGGNDGLRGLPLLSIKTNLKKLIEASLKHKAQVLLLGIQLPPNYGPEYTVRFKQLYYDLAKSYDIPIAPFMLQDIALQDKYMHSDGIHPTAEAQPLIAELLFPEILAALGIPESQCQAK